MASVTNEGCAKESDRGAFVNFFTSFYSDITRDYARFWSYVALSIWIILLFALSVAAYYAGTFVFTAIVVALQSLSFVVWLASFIGFWVYFSIDCKGQIPPEQKTN